MKTQLDNYFEEIKKPWPKPTMERPTFEELSEMDMEGFCEATDGCPVEPDGMCQHGHPSWLLKIGVI